MSQINNLIVLIFFVFSISAIHEVNGLYINNGKIQASNKLVDCLSTRNESIKCLPSAIIIGVKKSGTYALLRYLSINPQVVAALKINDCLLNEIHYFDHDSNFERGINWYKSQMPNLCRSRNGDIGDNLIDTNVVKVVEKTPGYFRSEKTPERVYNLNPNMKIMLIVRDPVKRLQSELTHCDTRQKKFNLERKCLNTNTYFENLFNVSLNANKSRVYEELSNNKFIRNSIYYLDMIKWFEYFNLTNIFVINGENFIKSPWIELKKVEKFLNIKNFIAKNHFHFVKNKNFYCLNEFKSMNNTINKSDYGCLGKNKGRKNHVYLSPYVKNELKFFFKSWNQLFFNLIGQKFNW